MWRISPSRRRAASYFWVQSEEHAAKEIRAFGLGSFFTERLRRLLTAANRRERGLDLRQLIVQSTVATVSMVMLAVGLALVVHQALSGALMVGEVTVAIAAIGAAQSGAGGLVREAAQIHHALLLFGHYDYVLAATKSVTTGVRPATRLRSGTALRDVWFRYSDDAEWALRDVNLIASPTHRARGRPDRRAPCRRHRGTRHPRRTHVARRPVLRAVPDAGRGVPGVAAGVT